MGRGGSNDRSLFGITEQAKDLPELIGQHVADGRRPQAAAMITRRLPDVAPIPLRFSSSLSRVDNDTANWLMKRVSRDAPVKLTVKLAGERHEIRAANGRKMLGVLPKRDTATLRSFGKDAALYSPQLLQIHTDSRDGSVHVSIELVRPEMNLCSSCLKEHTGMDVNCDSCKAKRRRKNPQPLEPSPIELQEAIESIAQIGEDEKLISDAA